MYQLPMSSLNDKAYLTAIYQRYAPALFAYLWRSIGVMEDTEDLLLEVFLAALERPGFEELNETEQKAWLWSVARNKMVDHYRKKKRHTGVPLDILPEEALKPDLETPEVLLLRSEERYRLRATIRHLPALQQEIVHLRFTLNLSSSEIAAILQKSEGAVRVMLSRALKLLRRIYENEQEDI